MAGTWPAARAALVALLEGLTWQVDGHEQETLTASEFPHSAVPTKHPYAYIPPPRRSQSPGSGRQRRTVIQARVRVVLAGKSPPGGMRPLSERLEAAIAAIGNALDGAVALGGAADVIGPERDYTGLEQWPEDGDGWGFVLELPVTVTETVTLTA